MCVRTRLRLLFCVSLVVLAISAPMMAQTDHPVDIGRGGIRLAFTDNQSGTNITFVNPGDTVTWTWRYLGIGHSTTNSTCTPTVPGSCPLTGSLWDSTILVFGGTPPNPTFTRTFNNLGTFPYFCEVHGEPDGMRGQVVVANGPDFALDLAGPSSFSTFPSFTTSTVAGQPMQFLNGSNNGSGETSKLVAGFGYNSPVTLSCQNGSPAPNSCPGGTITPKADGSSTITSSNFPVTNTTFGDFTFDVVATGSDPNHVTHSIRNVHLHVSDFNLSTLSVNSVTVRPGTSSQPITFQVIPSPNGFNGFLTPNCSGLPVGMNCIFNPFFINLFGSPVPVSLTITNTNVSSGTFQIKVQEIFNNGQSVVRSQDLTVLTGGPTHFSLSAPAQAIAGTPFSVTATALDDAQQVVTNYTGTVHFTSSDGAAVLPANFTFSGVDHGAHTFTNGVTLKTFGSRTVTVTDISALINGTTSPISVVPADHLGVQVPGGTEIIAGTPFNLILSALDGSNNPVSQYADTIHFTSSDNSITVRPDYTFVPGSDNGTHTFGLTLTKVEPITITATDLSFTSLNATTPLLTVVPAHRLMVQVPANVTAGTPFSLVVTAVDAAGNPVPQFTDTIHFAISDAAASGALPADYLFTGSGSDNGTHSFNLTLSKVEPVIITVTDLSFPGLATASPLILVGNSSFDGSMTLVSSRAGQAPPHFAVGANAGPNGSVNFMATVHLNSGDPAGNVRFFDGSTELGVQPLSAPVSGTATATYTIDGITQQLRPGGHMIVGVYEPGAGTGTLAVVPQPRSPAPRCDNTRCP